ncbi:hypothetical protein PanWU01x14_070540 [Parasponia andersonii]|uniref:Uncharacterized protein n=1 Tax=Parasponia andersonii TaxID=3476 RepID=A0A2P5DF22_PARAD|nr:hypothetical protein PanWU01x14_070540 [Parasponia andersonii]
MLSGFLPQAWKVFSLKPSSVLSMEQRQLTASLSLRFSMSGQQEGINSRMNVWISLSNQIWPEHVNRKKLFSLGHADWWELTMVKKSKSREMRRAIMEIGDLEAIFSQNI